jgi:hypothetical protein
VDEAVKLGQPLSLRMILDEAARLGRRHFREMYLPVALPVACVQGLMPLTQARWMRHMVSGRPPDFGAFLPDLALFILGALLVMSVTVIGYLALTVGAVDAVAGRALSMRRAWTALLNPRALGTMALNWLAVLLGTCLCCVPGIYVVLLLTLLVPVIVEEGRFGTAALARSAELTRYNPRRVFREDPAGHVFLILFVGFLLNYAVGFVTQLPAMVVQQVLMFRQVSSGHRIDPGEVMASLTWIQVPSAVLNAFGQVAVQIYVSFGIALLFFELRRRKEGADLEAAIESLAVRPENHS